MAIETGFGSVAVTQSFTDQYVYSDIPMPTGRQMADGSRATLVQQVRAFAAGRGGARAMSISLAGRTSSAFTVGSAGSAVNTGWRDIPNFLVAGGTQRLQLNFTGSTYFGRGTDGNGRDSYGTVYGTLGGGYLWAQSPSQCGIARLGDNGDGIIHVSFNGPIDDGGASVGSYQTQWSTSASFSSNVGSKISSGSPVDITGLQSGTRYYVRVAARNAVTDAAGTVGPWSSTQSYIAPGAPSAPRTATATQITSRFDSVLLKWAAPTDTAGGINGYDIWNGSSATKPLLSTNGTGTQAEISGLQQNAHYSFHIHARNDYVDNTGVRGPGSNVVEYDNWAEPSAPRSLTAVASTSVAGRVDLAWAAPTDDGAGITKYTVYYSTGAKIADVSASTLKYTVLNLTPGTYYAFYVVAWTSIAEKVGTSGPKSNTASATSLGDPNKPTSLTVAPSSMVSDRLTLSWAQAGGYTGFYIFQANSDGSYTQLGSVTGTKFVVDNLPGTGPYSFAVAARNTVTDQKGTYGPLSAIASGSPSRTSQQTVAATVATDTTNVLYNGSYQVSATTATTLSYARTSAADYKLTAVSQGTATNASNASLSGTHAITSIPSANTFTFTFTSSGYDIPANTAVTGVTATNLTSQQFTKTASSPGAVTAVDATNLTISYVGTGVDVSTRAVPVGTVTNLSNTVFNGSNITITGATENTIQYPKVNANLSVTAGTGSIVNTTNRDVYNSAQNSSGAVTVVDTPTYNSFTYNQGSATQAATTLLDPFGEVHRATSKAVITIKYRSGWAG